MSNQIIRFDEYFSKQARQQKVSPSTTATLKKFRAIQKASNQLYTALSRACTAHGDHFAKFSLEAVCKERIEDGDSLICFNMAYAPAFDADSMALEDLSLSATSEPAMSVFDWPRESSWFEVESESFTKIEQTNTTGHVHCEDLCVKLLAIRSQNPAGKRLVITLNDLDKCQHNVYLPATKLSQNVALESTTLTDFLSPANTHHIGNVPQLHRIRIAKSLAIAVLQFHTTPWLTEAWQSESLLLAKLSDDDWRNYIPFPHLVARISATPTPSLSKLPALENHIVPNPILFNLGVMLLELAYGVPFTALLQTTDFDPSKDKSLAHFLAARRLAINVGAYFGVGYAEIVRRCLRCDFGQGEDLNNLALQQRVFEDVICRLTSLEEGMLRSLGLA